MMKQTFFYTSALEQEISLIKKNNVLDEIIISLFKKSYKIDSEAIRIGLIGDAHGKITPALKKLEEWEKFSGLKFDSILQVGDLGVFPSDKISKKMIRKNPEEEGFIDYFFESDDGNYFFGETGIFSEIGLYFIDGNHDSIETIKNNLDERTFQLNGHYKNIHYVPSGKKITISKQDKKIIVGALGFNHEKKDVKELSKFDLDILLSHIPPESFQEDLRNIKRKYHFFGHVHNKFANFISQYENKFALNEIKIKRNSMSEGGLGFLEIGPEKSIFLYLPSQDFSLD